MVPLKKSTKPSAPERSLFHCIKIESHAKCYVHLKTALKQNTVDFADNRSMLTTFPYNVTNPNFERGEYQS